MSLTAIYQHRDGQITINGVPTSMDRARRALAFHTERAEIFARIEPEHEIAASLRDEMLAAIVGACLFELNNALTALHSATEVWVSQMRAAIAAEDRPGAVVIPFPARVAVPVQSLESN